MMPMTRNFSDCHVAAMRWTVRVEIWYKVESTYASCWMIAGSTVYVPKCCRDRKTNSTKRRKGIHNSVENLRVCSHMVFVGLFRR